MTSAFSRRAQRCQSIEGLRVDDERITARVVAFRGIRQPSPDFPTGLGRNRNFDHGALCGMGAALMKKAPIGEGVALGRGYEDR
jgi:hypothetical protein